jgi:hypothetical protein
MAFVKKEASGAATEILRFALGLEFQTLLSESGLFVPAAPDAPLHVIQANPTTEQVDPEFYPNSNSL